MSNKLSKEDLAKLSSKKWRMLNLYYITNKQKKKVKFKPNIIQLVLMGCLLRLKAILKARQQGVSTFFLLYYLDTACFNKNRTVCILAHEQDAIKKLFRIVRYAYDNMHPDLKPVLDRGGGSKYELYFPEINSRIYCDLESRGDTISDLHISEYAFIKDVDRVNATIDAVPVDTGRISIETTANGLNHFYKNWKSSSWPYKKHFFPWFFTREYKLSTLPIDDFTEEEIKLKKIAKEVYDIDLTDEEIAFRRFKISQKGKRHFLQEFPEDDMSCFLMSGSPVMDKFYLQGLIDKLKSPVEVKRGVKYYEKPISGVSYVLGCDVAEGVNADYSVCTVYRRDTLKQVALYRDHIKPFDFADKIMEIAKIYTQKDQATNMTIYPCVAVERNNHGHATLGKLELDGYQNIYRSEDDRIGWVTNKVSRPLMIDTLIEGIESGSVKVSDKDTLDECMTLVDNKGKIEAENGCHDDCVIASAIAVKVCLKKPIVRNIRITGL